MKEIVCPVCEGKTKSMGEIPPSNVFAGRKLCNQLEGGGLYRCKCCELGFRWPQLTQDQYDNLYANGLENTWSSSAADRPDWRYAYEFLSELCVDGSRVLDVACFDGSFLGPLTDRYVCYGVEIHPVARLVAESKGVHLIDDLAKPQRNFFDFITVFDFIEHVSDPSAYLNEWANALKPGGFLLVSTGNLDSFSFKLMRSSYWYCVIPEHVSIISKRWVVRNLPSSMRIERFKYFSHFKSKLRSRIKETFLNIFWLLSPKLVTFIQKLAFLTVSEASAPVGWGSSKDHFMVLLKRTDH